MPTPLLASLRRRGIRFAVIGDRLRWTPRDAVRPDEVELLRQHKADLIRELTSPPEPGGVWLTRALTAATGKTWHSAAPAALADDAEFTRRGVTHKIRDCPATESWRHVFGGTYCATCWPCTDPRAMTPLVDDHQQEPDR